MELRILSDFNAFLRILVGSAVESVKIKFPGRMKQGQLSRVCSVNWQGNSMLLFVLQSKSLPQPIEIGEGQTITVGRSTQCDAVLNNPHVSRTHCSLICKNGRVSLVDNQSKTGTLVNRIPISKTHLDHRDVVQIGGIELTFLERGRVDSPANLPDDKNDPDITLQLQKLGDADDQAAAILWEKYYPRLVEFARKKFGTAPRRGADEEDVALSAMNSLFCGIAQGRLVLGDRDELVKLLFTIAKRKVRAERRRVAAKKRGGGQIRGESVFIDKNQQDDSAGIAQVQHPNPVPDDSEQFLEQCQDLLEKLDDDRLQRAALMRFEGYGNQEIADEFGVSLSYVNQWFSKIKEIWSQPDPDAE